MVLLNGLKKLSIWPVVLVSGVLFVLAVSVWLPAYGAEADVYTADAGVPDLRFVYGPDDVYRMAESYGEEGRQFYIRGRYTFDLLWPLVYTLFYATFIVFGITFVHGKNSRWNALGLAVVLTMLFDFIENGLAVLVMGAFPDRMDSLVYLMASATALKWVTMGIGSMAFAYLLVAMPIALIKRRISRSARSQRSGSDN